jgi:hypothetical protein
MSCPDHPFSGREHSRREANLVVAAFVALCAVGLVASKWPLALVVPALVAAAIAAAWVVRAGWQALTNRWMPRYGRELAAETRGAR